MDKDVILKKDTKDFINLALELERCCPELFIAYKNRMKGAVEVQKLYEAKNTN